MTYICLGRKVSKVEKFRILQTCHSYNESAIVVSFQFLVLVDSRTLVVLVYYDFITGDQYETFNLRQFEACLATIFQQIGFHSNVLVYIQYTRTGPAQARVSTDIFHESLKETCSDTRITLVQYPIILAAHSVHFAKFLRVVYTAEWF